MPIIAAEPVKIGRSDIGGRKTTIVTSIFSADSMSLLSRFNDGYYGKGLVYEIRYDLFHAKGKAELEKLISALNGMSLDFVFTYRFIDSREGKEMYDTAISLGAPAIDIDVSCINWIDLSRYRGTVIISTHDFNGGRVSHMLNGMMKFGGDIYKLASTYTDPHGFLLDLSDLYSFKKENRVPLSLVPMGMENSAFRLFSGYLLSDIVYASGESLSADGQLTRKEYEDFYKKF
ncbi:3-dehydroquinate dehydratase [Thermoplasmatales archaeon]|nr:3-dehydroquinate dehydratase [Thermoplasmatales archaeon]